MSEGQANGVDAIVRGLVREYLFRNGHIECLRTLDEEIGTEHDTVNLSVELIKQLKLGKLYKRNKSEAHPLPSVLEVLAAHYVAADLATNATDGSGKVGAHPTMSDGQVQSARSTHSALPVTSEPEVQPALTPAVPSSVTAATAAAVATAAAPVDGFWARLNASKAAASVPAAPSVPVHLVSQQQPPPAPAEVAVAKPATGGTSSAPGSGGGFWANLAAAKEREKEKAAAEAAAAPTANASASIEAPASSRVEPPAPSTAPSAAPTIPPAPQVPVAAVAASASAASSAAGGFWARLNASKAAPAPAAAEAPVAPPAATLSTQSSAPAVPEKFAFIAPDGKGFNDRAEYRRYVFDTFYTLKGKTGQMFAKGVGEIAGNPFNLADLTDCEVQLCDHSETVQVDRLTRCHVFVAACGESLFMRNCVDCVFTVACKQLRTRDCARCVVRLYSKTEPVVERSYGMRFGPFNGWLPGLRSLWRAANLDPAHNHWAAVFDFSRDDAALPQPHWSVMDPSEYGEDWIINDAATGGSGDSTAQPENPVQDAPTALPTVVKPSADENGMLTFDIRTTSQSAAQARLEQLEGEAQVDEADDAGAAPVSSREPARLEAAPAADVPPSAAETTTADQQVQHYANDEEWELEGVTATPAVEAQAPYSSWGATAAHSNAPSTASARQTTHEAEPIDTQPELEGITATPPVPQYSDIANAPDAAADAPAEPPAEEVADQLEVQEFDDDDYF